MVRVLRDLGGVPERPVAAPPPPRRDDAARIERARALWAEARPLDGTDPASRYLAKRRIETVISSVALRCSSAVPHPTGGRRLALMAKIDDTRGELIGLQRIYLTPTGEKASIEPVKASLGIVAGGAVRLAPAGDAVVVAEGIESAAAAGLLLGLPAWAAVSAGNLARTMALPETIRRVVIAADHDEAGLRAAEEAARRWRAEGRVVQILRAVTPGLDAADLIEGRCDHA